MELNAHKIMTKAAEKAGINTRNGDTYFLEEKAVAGEKLLKMTKTIIEEAQSHLREKIEEELQAESHYKKDDDKKQEESEDGKQHSQASEETLPTIERYFQEQNDLLEKQTNRIIEKLDEIKKAEQDRKSETPSRQFLKKVNEGLTKTSNYKEILDQNQFEDDELTRLLEKLKKRPCSKGYANAPRLLKALYNSDNKKLSRIELSRSTKLSESSVRDSMRYLDENLQEIKYKVEVNGRRKLSHLILK